MATIVGNTKGVLDSVFSFSYGIYLQGLQSKLQSGYAVVTTLELVGKSVMNNKWEERGDDGKLIWYHGS